VEKEIAKQAFWINMGNFLTLLRLAEITILKPELLKRMQNYS
jgi:hypothetical protein